MSETPCPMCHGKRGIYLHAGPEKIPAVCIQCNADGAATPDLPEWTEEPAEPRLSERAGPVAWCEGCLHERVAFDWQKDRQLCPDCEQEASHA